MFKNLDNTGEIINLYRKRARNYDITANLYYLFGYREQAYRKKAVKALNLKPGDTVVDLCCGTGLNFSLLEKEVGEEGKIIGVDLTDSMLEQARERIIKKGWSNIKLVHSDAAKFEFPKNLDGVISTYALALVPEQDKVIKNIYGALAPGKRFVELSLKMPNNWLSLFKPFLFFIVKPFGDPEKFEHVHPWESVEKYFKQSSFVELYGGISYIAIGEK